MCHTIFRIVNKGNIKIWPGITGMQFMCLCCTLGKSFKLRGSQFCAWDNLLHV